MFLPWNWRTKASVLHNFCLVLKSNPFVLLGFKTSWFSVIHCSTQFRGAFHSTKYSKFWLQIKWNTSVSGKHFRKFGTTFWGCPKKWEYRKFRKERVPFESFLGPSPPTELKSRHAENEMAVAAEPFQCSQCFFISSEIETFLHHNCAI